MQEEMNDVLARAKELIREEITPLRYNTTIKPIEIISLTDTDVCLKVQTLYQKSKIMEQYCADLLKEALLLVTEKDLNIEIICEEELAKEKESSDEIEKTLPITQSQTGKAANNGVLNPKYTFDSFVIGKSNELAHAAALATAENPGRAYNPLFLYGGVGLGKTHLMQAVGNYVLSQNRSARVLYITGEKFTNELVFSIQSNKNEDFRAKYRNIDLLLVDDIQFISGKERSQEEFFHTFNELYENNKQIVISSDRPPKDLNPLEERLRSRFEWGLITDLSKPDYETRYAILRKKIESDKIIIDEEILSLIANKVESNIRELEGTLNKIVAMASLTNMPISMSLAERALGDLQHSKEKVITVDYIQSVVAKYYNIDKADFKVQRRSGDIAFPRQIAMYLSKQLTGQPLVEIGKSFGGRDHTTVIYAINKIESIIKTDPNTRTIVDNIRKMIIN